MCVYMYVDHVSNNRGQSILICLLLLQNYPLVVLDPVNHYKLQRKLGVKSLPLKWLTYYLSDRDQWRDCYNTISRKLKVECGVPPQGSILGPLLFLVYIHDISTAVSKAMYQLYADGNMLYLSGDDTAEITGHFKLLYTTLKAAVPPYPTPAHHITV